MALLLYLQDNIVDPPNAKQRKSTGLAVAVDYYAVDMCVR